LSRSNAVLLALGITLLAAAAGAAAQGQEPPVAPPEDMLLIDSFGRVVAVPISKLPANLLPPANVGLSGQIPTQAARGGKMPPEVLDRIETAAPQGFTLFPSSQPRLESYLAGLDELGNTLLRPGPLFRVFPLERELQGAKYAASRRGFHYLLLQSFVYGRVGGEGSGGSSPGFYALDLLAKWTVFRTPDTAGWLSAEFQAEAGLNEAGDPDDAGSLGSLTVPAGLRTGRAGVFVPELAWQQAWRRGQIVLLTGIIDQFNYLDANLYANSGQGQFMNSALINSMVLPLSAYNLGVNLQWQPQDAWYAILGVSAGNTAAGRQPWADFDWTDWSAVGELGYAPDDFLGLGPGAYRIQPFLARKSGPIQGGVGFNFRQQLGPNSPFAWFGRFGIGGSAVSGGASTQIGTGLVLQAPLRQVGLAPSLSNDVFGVGFVWSQPSATTKTVYHRDEYVFEAVYTLQLAPAVRLQPDLQLIWQPVFDPADGTISVFQLEWLIAW
jgi:hypothetical protein